MDKAFEASLQSLGSQRDLSDVPFVSAVSDRKKVRNLVSKPVEYIIFSFFNFCFLLLQCVIASDFKPSPVSLVCISDCQHLEV